MPKGKSWQKKHQRKGGVLTPKGSFDEKVKVAFKGSGEGLETYHKIKVK